MIDILRRDRTELEDAYDDYHKKDLEKFNEIYIKLQDKKWEYYLPKHNTITKDHECERNADSRAQLQNYPAVNGWLSEELS